MIGWGSVPLDFNEENTFALESKFISFKNLLKMCVPTTFIDHVMDSRHCSEHFIYIIGLVLRNNPVN